MPNSIFCSRLYARVRHCRISSIHLSLFSQSLYLSLYWLFSGYSLTSIGSILSMSIHLRPKRILRLKCIYVNEKFNFTIHQFPNGYYILIFICIVIRDANADTTWIIYMGMIFTLIRKIHFLGEILFKQTTLLTIPHLLNL